MEKLYLHKFESKIFVLYNMANENWGDFQWAFYSSEMMKVALKAWFRTVFFKFLYIIINYQRLITTSLHVIKTVIL